MAEVVEPTDIETRKIPLRRGFLLLSHLPLSRLLAATRCRFAGHTGMLFRRSRGGPTWHFCQNCAGWPEQDYEEETIEPDTGLCTECTRRLTDLKCETGPEEGVS
jgi:hypothetical protein